MKLSDSEWIVMRAVWGQDPVSARDVLERTGQETGWAYTTVRTILERLVDKGILQVSKRANTSLYEPLLSRKQAQHSALRSLLDRAFDGTFGSLLQHLAAEEHLSKKDRERLVRILSDLEGENSANAAAQKSTAARKGVKRRSRP